MTRISTHDLVANLQDTIQTLTERRDWARRNKEPVHLTLSEARALCSMLRDAADNLEQKSRNKSGT